MSEYEYDVEKAAAYTEQIIAIAKDLWGDVPLHPETHTWADGTVSVLVEHRRPNYDDLHRTAVCKLNFQEDGFRDEDGPALRETVSKGRGSDLLYSERRDELL